MCILFVCWALQKPYAEILQHVERRMPSWSASSSDGCVLHVIGVAADNAELLGLLSLVSRRLWERLFKRRFISGFTYLLTSSFLRDFCDSCCCPVISFLKWLVLCLVISFWFTSVIFVVSVCLFVQSFLSRLWSDFDQTRTRYMSGSSCVP